MDIYEYLKLDHQRVSQLFKQFEKTESLIRKQQIVALIAQELTVHADSEEATFYKTLELFEEAKEEACHGEKEHLEIKTYIKKALKDKGKGASLTQLIKKLKETVDHHVREEEGKIFRKAKKVLSKTDAYELKEKMHHLKQTLLLKLKKEEKNG